MKKMFAMTVPRTMVKLAKGGLDHDTSSLMILIHVAFGAIVFDLGELF